jgi:hypothetical protein
MIDEKTRRALARWRALVIDERLLGSGEAGHYD